MSRRGLLIWYPRDWRERYGDELLEVIERSTDGGGISFRIRFDVARNGLKQRLIASGIAGDVPGRERLTGGALLVLWTFGAAVIAGIALQKYSEHWQDAAHGNVRWLAQASFLTVESLAAVGALILVLAGLAGLPALKRFIETGGWPLIRRRFWVAAALCTSTVAAMSGVVIWAHHLTNAQRNGGSHPYNWAAPGFAVLVCATIAGLSALVSRAARTVELPRAVLRFEGALAIALEITMALLAVATAVWWAAVAHMAPWFFQTWTASPGGAVAIAVNSTMPIVLSLMVAATIVGALGARRVREGLARPD